MTLLTKLQEAKEGSRELDAALHEAITTFRPKRAGPGWRNENDFVIPVFPGFAILPAYTTSLDAALALVGERLPGWRWAISEGARASLQKGPPALSRGSIPITAKHKSPAIAICIALIKALEKDEPHE